MRIPNSEPGPPPFAASLPVYYGWVILPIASLSMFISGPGQTYTVSVFVDPIIKEFEWSRTMVASLYTAGSLTAAAIMLLVGRLLDRYGARLMLLGVGTLFGLAMLWMSQVSNPVELFVGFAAIRTLGQGSLTLIPTTLVALWFVRLRGRVMAINNALGSVASQAAFPPLIYLLIVHLGWRGAWLALSVIIWGVLLIPAAVLVRRSPESVGLRPDGAPALPESEQRQRVSPTSEVHWTLSEAVRTRAFWLLLFAVSSQSLISTALVFHHVSLITSKGLDAGMAAVVLSVMAPIALLGNFTAGLLADRLPTRYLLAAAQMLIIAAMAWSFAISQPWEAILYGGALGLGGGFFININSVIWANYYGRLHLGSIQGLTTAGMVGFAALGPMPFGLLYDLTGSYELPLLIFLVLPATCAVAALLAHPPQKKARGSG